MTPTQADDLLAKGHAIRDPIAAYGWMIFWRGEWEAVNEADAEVLTRQEEQRR